MIPKPLMEALGDARLSDAALRVLVSLWSHAKRKQLTVWPKRERIAEQTGLDKWQVSKATRLLEEAGYVAKEGAGGYSKATRYTLQNGVATNTVDGQLRCHQEHRKEQNYGVTSDTGPGVTSDTRKEVSIGSSSKRGNTKIGSSVRTRDVARAARGSHETEMGQESDGRSEASSSGAVPAQTPRGRRAQDPRARRRGESAAEWVRRVQSLDDEPDRRIVAVGPSQWRRE